MDKAAKFESLYRQYYTPIYKFCFRLLNSREGALDVTQETFIKFYERMNQQGNEIENKRAWLYKVAGNLSLNSLNKKNRHGEIKDSLDFRSIDDTNPEAILIENEKKQMIRDAIGQLKPESRMLVMMYQDGLTYKEIADATGIRFNSVGNTLWRVINKMSENIKLQGHE
jgi:RNA polymerase sigma-70 factor (ECF subfamily)